LHGLYNVTELAAQFISVQFSSVHNSTGPSSSCDTAAESLKF